MWRGSQTVLTLGWDWRRLALAVDIEDLWEGNLEPATLRTELRMVPRSVNILQEWS